MRQPLRVALFFAALFVFALCTYLAIWQAHLSSPLTEGGNFFTAGWWLRPIEFNRGARLHHVDVGVDFTCISALEGGRQIWIGGTKGMIIHSEDGGASWRQLPTVKAPDYQPPLRRKAAKTRETEGVMPIAFEEQPKAPPDRAAQKAIPNKMNRSTPNAPAIDYEQQTQQAIPTPTPPQPAPGLNSNSLVDLQFVSSSAAFATNGTQVLRSGDGGKTWQIVKPATYPVTLPWRLRFVDGNRGVVVGSVICETTDGGETWSDPVQDPDLVFATDLVLRENLSGYVAGAKVAELTAGKGGLNVNGGPSIRGAEGQMLFGIAEDRRNGLFVCGSGGLLARSPNRYDWEIIDLRATGDLNRILFASETHGWVVGQDGQIFATTDGGQRWSPQNSGTRSNLKALYFASAATGFAAGSNGTVITTNDGGANWYPLVVAGDGSVRSHVWLPPPWYFASLVLLFGLVRRIPPPTPPLTSGGVAQLLLSDRPLRGEDPDYLGFHEVALGLSNYLRNEATQPPLTIAITGEWGMGKSSLMNLLGTDLRKHGFRPVWFNAWHHEAGTEESLLASLLQNVRSQAIPGWYSANGFAFRAKLLWLRARQHLVATLLLIGVAGFCLSYFSAHGLTSSPQPLVALFNTATRITEHVREGRSEALAQTLSGLSGRFAVLLAALTSVVTFFRALRPFGIDPAKLLASSSGSATTADLREQTAFRYRFAREFAEVTQALNPRTMLIFIDDLDRCQPIQVYRMLESLNFLVSCGDCFVVMGFARRRVERCVGLVFQDVAAEGPDLSEGDDATPTQRDAQKRQRFARSYLEKLINIEVAVPRGDTAQMYDMLSQKAREVKRRTRLQRAADRIVASLPHLIPASFCALVALVAMYYGAIAPQQQGVTVQPNRAASVSAPVSTPPPANSQPANAAQLNEAATARLPKAEIGEAHFFPGRAGGKPILVLALLALALGIPGGIALFRRSEAVIKDSPAFVRAMADWFPVVLREPGLTPRAVKRFVNRVRYFAMMQGVYSPARRWWEKLLDLLQPMPAPTAEILDSLPSDSSAALLVALGTIHEKHPEWFQDDFDSFRRRLRSLPEDLLSNLTRELVPALDEASYLRFKKLVSGVEVR